MELQCSNRNSRATGTPHSDLAQDPHLSTVITLFILLPSMIAFSHAVMKKVTSKPILSFLPSFLFKSVTVDKHEPNLNLSFHHLHSTTSTPHPNLTSSSTSTLLIIFYESVRSIGESSVSTSLPHFPINQPFSCLHDPVSISLTIDRRSEFHLNTVCVFSLPSHSPTHLLYKLDHSIQRSRSTTSS